MLLSSWRYGLDLDRRSRKSRPTAVRTTSAGQIRRTAILIAASSLAALSTIALPQSAHPSAPAVPVARSPAIPRNARASRSPADAPGRRRGGIVKHRHCQKLTFVFQRLRPLGLGDCQPPHDPSEGDGDAAVSRHREKLQELTLKSQARGGNPLHRAQRHPWLAALTGWDCTAKIA
jgi:hypothetical protein